MNNGELTRRCFLKKAGSVTILGAAGILGSSGDALARAGTYATLIDLANCDGCQNEKIPKCIEACRRLNEKRFPVPQKPIKNLWPQTTHDDWSDKKDVINALTPYNWITVQRVEYEGTELFIPRRCMHCYNPPCSNLCPFGALDKFADGAVVINPNLCVGGAKCKAVCPWHIPQRQSGVGIYLKLQPIPAGGGVMYKCDLCHSIIMQGGVPACVEACRQRLGSKSPLLFGYREDMAKIARERAMEKGGFIYGEKENGGTATLYVSGIPFEKISAKLQENKSPLHMEKVHNRLVYTNRWVSGFITGPAALAVGAMSLALYKKRKNRKENE